jgi:hypothetical protein
MMLLLLGAICVISAGVSRATAPPHIVHIMADDTGVRHCVCTPPVVQCRRRHASHTPPALVLRLTTARAPVLLVERPGLQESHDPLAKSRPTRHRGRPAHVPLCVALAFFASAPPPPLTAADRRHRPCAGLDTPVFGIGADAFKVCSPSRSSFHTGRYPFTLGLYDNSPRAVPHLRPQITNGLDPDISVRRAVPSGYKLLPELLAAKGYRRHAVGKWHLGMALRKCASHLSSTEAAAQLSCPAGSPTLLSTH